MCFQLKQEEWMEKNTYKKKQMFLKENGINIITMLEEIEFDKIDILELNRLLNNIHKTKLEVHLFNIKV